MVDSNTPWFKGGHRSLHNWPLKHCSDGDSCSPPGSALLEFFCPTQRASFTATSPWSHGRANSFAARPRCTPPASGTTLRANIPNFFAREIIRSWLTVALSATKLPDQRNAPLFADFIVLQHSHSRFVSPATSLDPSLRGRGISMDAFSHASTQAPSSRQAAFHATRNKSQGFRSSALPLAQTCNPSGSLPRHPTTSSACCVPPLLLAPTACPPRLDFAE